MNTKDATITEETLEKIPYLRACIKETLRMYPVVLGNGRSLQSDTVISGYNVPKGVKFYYNRQNFINLLTFTLFFIVRLMSFFHIMSCRMSKNISMNQKSSFQSDGLKMMKLISLIFIDMWVYHSDMVDERALVDDLQMLNLPFFSQRWANICQLRWSW